MKSRIFIVIIAAVVLSGLQSCTKRADYVQITGFTQGGTYSVKANIAGTGLKRGELASAIDSILTLVDTTLSGYNKASVLSRYNNGGELPEQGLFADMVNYSRQKYDETGGALDVASAALFDLWGFGFTSDSLPSQESVLEVLSNCGMTNLDKHPKMNFNAVAQGYTCDLVASYLYSHGVKDMLVDIGEIYCDGFNPSGRPWSIGIDRPVDGNENPGADMIDIWVSSGGPCGVVTSGNYRKFYVRDGKKYAHTIDPRTGYPVSHNLLSATIVAPSAADADAYATYCMVIGLADAQAFIQSRSDIEGYLVYDSDGEMKEWSSAGFTLRRNQ